MRSAVRCWASLTEKATSATQEVSEDLITAWDCAVWRFAFDFNTTAAAGCRGPVLTARVASILCAGSLSNTLVAVSRLGASLGHSKELQVGLAGSVGSDALGEFYRSKMRHAGVSYVSPPITDGAPPASPPMATCRSSC